MLLGGQSVERIWRRHHWRVWPLRSICWNCSRAGHWWVNSTSNHQSRLNFDYCWPYLALLLSSYIIHPLKDNAMLFFQLKRLYVTDISYVFESAARGYYVYRRIWNGRIGEQLQADRSNTEDRFAIALTKDDETVRHVLREQSKILWHFLSHGGKLFVTGRHRRLPLLQGGLEIPCTCTFKVEGPLRLVQRIKQLLWLADCHLHVCCHAFLRYLCCHAHTCTYTIYMYMCVCCDHYCEHSSCSYN